MKNNLIGISGKIGSSKDTIGKILQYLATPSGSNEFTLEDYLTDKSSYLYAGNNYQIKKYAELPKNIVCLLIGCTREQLEDEEFKEKELGEEWWYKKAHYIDADGLDSGSKLFAWKDTNYEQFGYDYSLEPLNLTPRKLLQLLGTECGRQIIHPQIWVNALFADYNTPDKVEVLYNGAVDESESYTTGSNWIITDCRFPNEAQAIKDRGGIVIRVNRPCPECKVIEGHKFGCLTYKKLIEHPSETSLDNYEFDHVIDNNGSIEELVEKVKQLKLV